MKLGKRVGIIALGALLAGPSALAGNPVGDFFKRLGNSIAHPQQEKAAKHSSKTTAKNSAVVQPAASPAITPSPTPSPVVAGTPSIIRPGLRPPASNVRRDLPYGLPVPNKPGFVTSPYAPTRGYVDVRNFPSGTEVKDPYTNGIFLAP